MNSRRAIALILLLTTGMGTPSWGAFFSRGQRAISASATVSGAAVAGPAFTIRATPLPAAAFFGKNVVIPVQLVSNNGPINPRNLSMGIVFQLLNPSGIALGPPTNVPVTFSPTAAAAGNNTLSGAAIISSSDLQAIHNGGTLQYIFQVQQGGSRTMLNRAGQVSGNVTGIPSPFQTTIIDTICQPVGPEGAQVSVPDLFENDGQTRVVLAPGSVSGPGTLCIKQEDTGIWPAGPGGAKPAAVYSITLTNASLVKTAQLMLSYPADLSGKVMNVNANAGDLAIYWLGPEGLPLADESWRVLSRAQVDTTLHTVTGISGHFSTFALFAGGATSSADLRPAARIIAVNGLAKNRTAVFGAGIDQVKIFDIRGRRVKSIPGPSPIWDATDESGAIVESGIYIYQYTVQGDRISGVFMVAK